MIQKSPARKSSSRRNPGRARDTARDIARERRHIQSEWSLSDRRERARSHRVDAADLRFQAHLRFLRMLASTSSQTLAR